MQHFTGWKVEDFIAGYSCAADFANSRVEPLLSVTEPHFFRVDQEDANFVRVETLRLSEKVSVYRPRFLSRRASVCHGFLAVTEAVFVLACDERYNVA